MEEQLQSAVDERIKPLVQLNTKRNATVWIVSLVAASAALSFPVFHFLVRRAPEQISRQRSRKLSSAEIAKDPATSYVTVAVGDSLSEVPRPAEETRVLVPLPELSASKPSDPIPDSNHALSGLVSPSPQAAIEAIDQAAWAAANKQNLSSPDAYLPSTLGQGTKPGAGAPHRDDAKAAPAAREPVGSAKKEETTQLVLADGFAKGPPLTLDRHSLEISLNSPVATPSRDASGVIATLERYSDAWNTKDVADITAIRPGLGRRTVKEELSSVRSIVMRIRPTSVPRIEGDRATVECIHQVDQIFKDGIEKQNPGVRMTYVLVKRDGNWLIADSR